MTTARQDAVQKLSAGNRAVARHTLRTAAVKRLLQRAVELELREDDELPTGRVRVVLEIDFGFGPGGGDGYTAAVPHTVGERLVNLANRCGLVLACDDRQGDDLCLVRRDAGRG